MHSSASVSELEWGFSIGKQLSSFAGCPFKRDLGGVSVGDGMYYPCLC